MLLPLHPGAGRADFPCPRCIVGEPMLASCSGREFLLPEESYCKYGDLPVSVTGLDEHGSVRFLKKKFKIFFF